MLEEGIIFNLNTSLIGLHCACVATHLGTHVNWMNPCGTFNPSIFLKWKRTKEIEKEKEIINEWINYWNQYVFVRVLLTTLKDINQIDFYFSRNYAYSKPIPNNDHSFWIHRYSFYIPSLAPSFDWWNKCKLN